MKAGRYTCLIGSIALLMSLPAKAGPITFNYSGTITSLCVFSTFETSWRLQGSDSSLPGPLSG